MAAGGAFNVGSIYVDLTVRDAAYHAAMARAQAAFQRLVTTMRSGAMASIGPYARLTSQVDALRAALVRAAAAARQLNRQMGGASSAWAQVIRAQGAAIGSVVRAAGSAASSIVRAFGTASSQQVRAVGSAAGAAIRSAGAAASSVIRAVLSPLNTAIRGAASVARAAAALPGRIAGAFSGILGGLGVIGGAFGAGISIKKLIEETATAEGQMNALSRITGQSTENVNSMGRAFDQMASYVGGVDINKIYTFASFGAKLGVSNQGLELFTKDMQKLGLVFDDIDPEFLATRVARMLAVFHRGSDEAIRLSSALYKLDISSTANAREILDVASRLSGTASILGMTPQKAMALATALKQANIPTETAGTSMTQILGRMASKRDMASFARMAGMGKAQWRRLLTEDPLEAVKAFTEAVRRMEPVAAIQSLDKLHLDGQRVRTTLLQLAQVIHLLDGYVADANREWRTMSGIMEGAKSVSELLTSKWAMMQNNLNLMMRAMGAGLMPVFKGSMDALSGLFRDITDAIKDSADAIKGWSQWVADGIGLVGVLFREWRQVRDVAADFLGLQWERMGTILENLGARIRQIIKFEWMNGFHNTLLPLLETITDFLTKLGEYLIAKAADAFQGILAAIPLLGVAPPGPVGPAPPKFKGPAAPKMAGPPFDPWKNIGQALMQGVDVADPVRLARMQAGMNNLWGAAAGQQAQAKAAVAAQDVAAANQRAQAAFGGLDPAAAMIRNLRLRAMTPVQRRIFLAQERHQAVVNARKQKGAEAKRRRDILAGKQGQGPLAGMVRGMARPLRPARPARRGKGGKNAVDVLEKGFGKLINQMDQLVKANQKPQGARFAAP